MDYQLVHKRKCKSLKEYEEEELKKEKINEIKKDSFVKKILEIIPSSEVVSVREIDKS